MKLRPLLLIGVLMLVAFVACKKNKNSTVPSINFVDLSPDSVRSGSDDTTRLVFGFRDGDGDLGNDPGAPGGRYDVYLRDSRFRGDTNYQVGRYLFPSIPDDARDPIEGLKGEGVIVLRSLFILTRPDTLHLLHGDTLQYDMWITDRAGNISDTFTTTPLYILPQ